MSIFSGGTVEIRVFDKNDDAVLSSTSPADTAGSNFWGVWCEDTIGRINLWDTASGPGAGAQGADNIQMWLNAGVCGDGKCTGGEDCENCEVDCGVCPVCGNGDIEEGEDCDPPGPDGCGDEVCLDDCTCGDLCGDGICSAGENECNCSADCPGACEITEFTNQADFEAAMEDANKILKGIETFEESNLPPADVLGMDDPLCGGIPCAPGGCSFPNGLDQFNLCLQSNVLGNAPVVPSPQGINGLAAASAGFSGAVSDIVISNTFVNGLDLIFDTPKTGVGFDTLALLGGASVQIRVYDTAGIEILSTSSPAEATGANFWGVLSGTPIAIGRINIFDPGNGAEGGDNIQLWEAP
ncbi:MAG: hypothetical protein IID41_11720 [Planctomycetes bacterium]|nr:hypothetical protein [Planctomycetota bacterium]